MKVVKGEILKFKEGEQIAGYEGYEHCISVNTGVLDEIGVLPSDQYGQTDEKEFHVIPARSLQRTGKLIWEFDHTLFPHIIELLKEYYSFAVYEDDIMGEENDLQI